MSGEKIKSLSPVKKLAKRKILLFLIILIFLTVSYISSFFIEVFPASIGFLIILIAFLAIDLTSLSYAIYFKESLELKESYAKKEMNLYWIVVLSFVEIVSFGSLMNIPIQDYQKQSVEIILIAGVFFLLNEFWLLYLFAWRHKVSKSYEMNNKKLKQSIYGEAINCVLHFIFLASVAIKLPLPHNIISLGFLVIIFASVVFYTVNRLRKI